ncbi:MAG: hypothetical protein JWN84_4545 [Nocardioides sp.]|nr:hypothetical protein [Nocardioides sp.]
MELPSRALVERWWWLSGVVLLALMVGVDLGLDRQINGVYAGSAVLVAINSDVRRTVPVAALAMVASLASGVWNDNLGQTAWAVRFATCALICGLAVLAADVNQRRRRHLERTTALAQGVLDALAVELTGARTVKDVAEGFLGRAVGSLGASSAMVLSLDDDEVLRTVAWHGRGGSAADTYQAVPLSSHLPGAVAVREGVDVHYRSRKDILRTFPDLADYYPEDRSLHLLPLRRDDATYGLLALTFPAAAVTPSQDGFLGSLAGALTGAIVRAGELERQDAEAQRTTLLAEASLRLSRSLDMATTLTEVCQLLVPRFADWCAVQLLRDGRLETMAIQHRDPDTTRWALGLRDAFPTRMDVETGAPNVVRTGRSELYPFIPAELVAASAADAEHAAILDRLGFTSAVVAPLVGRQGVLGAVTLIHAESGRRYGEADVAFLEAVSDRAALALDTAAAFAEQSERLADVQLVADAAQQAILAPPPARAGALALSARYVSAAVAANVGGDLYEVVVGPSSTRLLVGDVRGKGLAAVRTATVAMGAFRAAAADPIDLAHVAHEMDRRIRPYLPSGEDFVTAVLVDVDPAGAFSVVSCGHPAPVLLTASGDVEHLDLDPSPPLGLGTDAVPEPVRGRLGRGDRLLLYTDGLVEARTPRGDFIDPELFLPAVATADFGSALDGLLVSLKAAADHRLEDDLALLLAGYHPD